MVSIMIRCHLIWRRLQLMLKKYKSKLVVMQTYDMNIVATSFMSFVNQDMGSRAWQTDPSSTIVLQILRVARTSRTIHGNWFPG